MSTVQELINHARTHGTKLSADDGHLDATGPDATSLTAREAEVVSFLCCHAVLERIEGLDEPVWVIRAEIPRGARRRTKRVRDGVASWGI